MLNFDIAVSLWIFFVTLGSHLIAGDGTHFASNKEAHDDLTFAGIA